MKGRVGGRLRVVHFSSVHRLDDVRIVRKECASLAAAGCEVVFIVPSAGNQFIGQVRIHAVPLPRSRWEGLVLTGWRVYRAARSEDAAVYHFHDPELIPVGLLLRMHGRRVIYDVHEDVAAQVLEKHWVPRWLRRPIAHLVRLTHSLTVRRFDGVVVAGADVQRTLGYGEAVIVRNLPLLAEFGQGQGPAYAERGMCVVHVGGLSRIRASRELIEAMDLIPAELPARLVLVGSFEADGLEAEVRQLPGWGRTQLLGWSSREVVVESVASARVGIVLFSPAPNHLAVRSNKVYEYMAAGLPIIAPHFPEWRALIESIGCGVVVDPCDPVAIAEAITALLRDPALGEQMGARGRSAAQSSLNWEAEAAVLLELYDRILRGARVAPNGRNGGRGDASTT